MKKRNILIIFVAAMVIFACGIFTCNAETVASGSCGEKVTWTLDDEGTLTISGDGSMSDYNEGEVPWAQNAGEITGVVVEDGVSTIGTNAFCSMNNLSMVSLPSSLKRINSSSFVSDVALKSIAIPENVVYIGENAFTNTVAILTVATDSFAYSYAINNDIPFDLTTGHQYESHIVIKEPDCISPGKIEFTCNTCGRTIQEDTPTTSNHQLGNLIERIEPTRIEDGMEAHYQCEVCKRFFNTEKQPTTKENLIIKCPNEILDHGSYNGATWYITGTENDMTLTIYGRGYVRNTTWEKYKDSITKIIVENDIQSIDEGVFSGCSNLTDITIPFVGEKLDASGMGTAFGYIFGRKEYPGSVRTMQRFITGSGNNTVDDYTYFYIPSSLKSITITKGKIRTYSLMGLSGVTNIKIPNGLTYIGDYAFYNCSRLEHIRIPESVTNIGTDAFLDCGSLKDVYYTGDIDSWCSITFESGFSNPLLGAEALYFNGIEITDITIPDGLTKINEYTFYGFDNMTSITIPESVTNIGTDAFYRCGGLKDVYYTGDIVGWCNITFNSEGSNPLHDSGSILGRTENLHINGNETTDITIPNGLREIKDYTFLGFDKLTNITIPESVTSIGKSAFGYCGSIKDITIPDSVTSIGKGTFYNCRKLKNITISSNVTSIEDYAFGNCSSLENITIPGSVTSIGKSAFYSCSKLENITIKSGVKRIGEDAFERCSSLTSVAIPNSVNTIGQGILAECSSLESVSVPFVGESSTSTGPSAVLGHFFGKNEFNGGKAVYQNGDVFSTLYKFVIPDSLKSVEITKGGTIKPNAFRRCNITNVTLPEGITTIGKNAFNMCRYIESITIPESVKNIDYTAFSSCDNLVAIVTKDSYAHSCVESRKMRYDLTTGHQFAITSQSEPNCINDANVIYTCSTCKEEKTEVLAATGHAWDEHYTIDRQATFTKDGLESIHCTKCDAIKEGSQKTIERITWQRVHIQDISDQVYTGRRVTPSPEVKIDNDVLKFNDDYCLQYSNNTDVGKAQIKIIFNEKYGEDINTVINFNIVSDPSADPEEMGYSLTVRDNKGSKTRRKFEGDAVNISTEAKAYETFSRWEIVSGVIELSALKLKANPLIFSMPASDVVLKAIYTGKSLDEEITAENNRHNAIVFQASSLRASINTYSSTADKIKNKYGVSYLQSASYYYSLAQTTMSTITERQNYLAALRANTAGGNATEIKRLEKEISGLQDEYQMYLELKSAAELQAQADAAQRELNGIDLDAESKKHEKNINSICEAHGVKDKSVSEVKYIRLEKDEYQYIGSDIHPIVTVITENDDVLGEESYSVEYPEDCRSIGVHELTVLFKGDYVGEKTKQFSIVDKCEHQYSEWVIVKEAKCTAEGLRERACSLCGCKESEAIQSTGHNLIPHVAKQATCTEAGNSAYWSCDRCNKFFSDENCTTEIEKDSWVIAKKPHKWDNGTVTTQPTCTAKGVKTFTCSVCGAIRTEDVNSLGHDYDSVVTDPTCTAKGYTTHTCSRCKDSYADTYTDAIGHKWGEWEDVTPSTCVQEGQQKRVCENDPAHVEYKDADLLNHDLEHIEATDPSCTENGNIEYWHCSSCQQFFSDETAQITISEEDTVVPAIGHDYEEVAGSARDAKCTEDGKKADRKCKNCNDVIEGFVIRATGHSWTESVSQNATEFSTGVMTHSCTRCGSSYTTVIPTITLPTDLPGVKLSKPMGAKGKITVKWKKPKKNNLAKIQGIEIRVVGLGVDKITKAGKKKTSKKIGGLKKKKKYTVQVRTYAYVNGVKHVSAWKTKSAKTK